MSSTERFALERSIRRGEYMHMLLAGLIGMVEQNLADQRQALASDTASRTQALDKRWGVPAQRKGTDS